MRETTALGAALAAGLAIGIWKNLNDFHSDRGMDIFTGKLSKDGNVNRRSNSFKEKNAFNNITRIWNTHICFSSHSVLFSLFFYLLCN